MRETMRYGRDIGLAAPQIGDPLQLAVIEDREEYLKCILSGDQHLLEPAEYQGISIVTPRAFLNILRRQPRP